MFRKLLFISNFRRVVRVSERISQIAVSCSLERTRNTFCVDNYVDLRVVLADDRSMSFDVKKTETCENDLFSRMLSELDAFIESTQTKSNENEDTKCESGEQPPQKVSKLSCESSSSDLITEEKTVFLCENQTNVDCKAKNSFDTNRDDDPQTSDQIGSKCKEKKRKTKSNSLRPNHFVAIQIRNKEIHNKIELLQKDMILQNELLKSAIIPLPTLHLTMAVMNFDSKEIEVLQRVNKAMEDTLNELKDDVTKNPLNIDFQGLDHFSSEVLFAKIKNEDAVNRLNDVANVIQKTFQKVGVEVIDERFKPHLTIMKLSKMKFKDKKLIKKIKPDVYKDAKDTNFGSDRLTSLQLLSMNDEKDAEGYYRCLKEVFF